MKPCPMHNIDAWNLILSIKNPDENFMIFITNTNTLVVIVTVPNFNQIQMVYHALFNSTRKHVTLYIVRTIDSIQ